MPTAASLVEGRSSSAEMIGGPSSPLPTLQRGTHVALPFCAVISEITLPGDRVPRTLAKLALEWPLLLHLLWPSMIASFPVLPPSGALGTATS